MRRWLAILVTICLASPAVDAQVFKPKSKKATAAKKQASTSADPEAKAAKKQPRATTAKKRPVKKKSNAGDRGSPDDLTPEPEPKGAAKDYVKIWDDDEIE